MRFLGCAAPARMLPPSKTGSERRAAIALGALWALALAVCALGLLGNVPGGRLQLLLLVAAANGAFAVWLLAARKRSLPAVALALASLVTTVWFNPLVLGGAEYVKGNELSQRILAIDRAAGGETTWVAFGSDEIANLFRALGVRSINGTHTLPQLELWARIDPGGRALPIYDRYAHVVFVAAPNRSPRFILPSEDYVILRIDPASPELRKLGATHALFRGDERERAAFERMAGYEYLGSVGKNHLYRLPALPADRPGD
jgi:hypothetical protein